MQNATDWQPISTAPRDRPVRIMDEHGSTKQPMTFKAPHWWDAPDGVLRLADASLYQGDEIDKATHWRE